MIQRPHIVPHGMGPLSCLYTFNMRYEQAITPNPHIPCAPGWCLAYVNEAFGVPKKYGTATAAWNGSSTKHRDYDFPADVWVPLWFSLKHEPAGHVVLRAPDGAIYSTTSPYAVRPTRHPNIVDLIYTYSFNNPLTYLGWTEDVEDTPVIVPAYTVSSDEQFLIDLGLSLP